MTTILHSENSALILYDLDENMMEIVKQCVETVDSELDVRPPVIVFGKVCCQNRSVGFYSDTSKGYNYSNKLMASKKMHPCLRELLIYINDKFDYDYNGILINKYSGGEDYIGKHSDDEKGLDSKVGVVALSYGAVRNFRIRWKDTGSIVKDVPTEPNKIIQMAGDFQKEFTHEIPIQKKVNGTRYSFTFRKHLE